jgi:hypothetical protein
MRSNGSQLKDGFNALAQEAGLSARYECVGDPVWSLIRSRSMIEPVFRVR